MPKVLILQATPVASQDDLAKLPGGRSNVTLFSEALTDALDGRRREGQAACALETFAVNVADLEALPQGMQMTDFDGVIITGSPLNAYRDEPAVRHQLDLCRAVFHSGVPSFGSCWGLQIMCAALGGTVHLNPKGREFGIARNIYVTEAGRSHDLYRGKDWGFDALCSHEDEVAVVPEHGTVLASNSYSRVQAVDVADDGKSFWGVQYHPEFDFMLIAALLERRAARQIADGYAGSPAAVGRQVADYRALHAAPSDLVWQYGVSPNITDVGLRRREFRNWLDAKVYPRMQAER